MYLQNKTWCYADCCALTANITEWQQAAQRFIGWVKSLEKEKVKEVVEGFPEYVRY